MAYVVQIQGSTIQYIRVYSAGIHLGKTNLRQSKYADCTHPLEPGEGVYRKVYQASGFLCQDCLSKFLQRSTSVAGGDGDAGFRLLLDFGCFVACTLGPRQYSTAEVIQAISRRPIMINALELGPLLAKGTIERANGAGVLFVAVFEASQYYKFYYMFSAKSPRSPRKYWKPIGYHGIFMGKHMSLDDMLKYVAVRVKDVVRTRQRFPRGKKAFDQCFLKTADAYKCAAVIPPTATFHRVRRSWRRAYWR